MTAEAVETHHMMVRRRKEWEWLPANRFEVTDNGTAVFYKDHGHNDDGQLLSQVVAVYPMGGWEEIRNSDPATWLRTRPESSNR